MNADGTVIVRYQVRVANGVGADLSHPAVADQLTLPAGFEMVSATLNGAPVTFTGGAYTIPASGTPVAAFGTRTYDLALTARVAATITPEQWTLAGTCNTSGAGVPAAGGFFNLVTMTGDSDGATNNDACVPVLAWKVEKAAAATGDLDAGDGYAEAGTAGSNVRVDPNGTVTVQYRVGVTNAGTVAGPHPAIVDTPTLPAGFDVTRVTVTHGGATVHQSAGTMPFVIPAQASPASVAAGGHVDYVVVLEAVAPDLDAVDWNAAATCGTEGAGTPSDGGFFNLVTMANDTDGTVNNDACVPVLGPREVMLQKVGERGQSLTGAEFQLYRADGTTPIGGLTQVDDSGRLTFTHLFAGTYVIQEVAAPVGYARDPNPYRFTIEENNAISLPAGQGGSLSFGADGAHLVFQNLRPLEYPSTGGHGTLPYAAVGLLLMAWGASRLRQKGRA